LKWGSVRFFVLYSNALAVRSGGVLRVERSETRAFKVSGLVFLFGSEKSSYDGQYRQKPNRGREKESE
jgi:hypothetical protein